MNTIMSRWTVPAGTLLIVGTSLTLLSGCGSKAPASQANNPAAFSPALASQTNNPAQSNPAPYYYPPSDGSESMDDMLRRHRAEREREEREQQPAPSSATVGYSAPTSIPGSMTDSHYTLPSSPGRMTDSGFNNPYRR